MPSDPVITVHNLGKMYPLYSRPRDRLNQSLWYALPGFLRRKPRTFFQEFWALREISFEVRAGEVLGVIGQNGSGKSTLLQMLAGTLENTEGELQIHGTRAALLELGSGFAPEFTGRENVYLAGSILGLPRTEIDRRFNEIAAFADIGAFIDQPVKLYSSGMYVRLAFAIQTAIQPDLLIIDEVLSVGDIFFQQKCFDRLDWLLARGTAIILVSHDMGIVQKYSTRTLLLHKGQPVFYGQPNEAVQRFYLVDTARPADGQPTSETPKALEFGRVGSPPRAQTPAWPNPTSYLPLKNASILGTGGARCTGIALCNSAGVPNHVFEMGETAHFFYEFETLTEIDVPVGGVTLTNILNVDVHGKNSAQASLEAPEKIPVGGRVRLWQRIDLALAPGQYTFSVGFSTIGAEEYAAIDNRPYAHFQKKAVVLALVQHAGTFQIVPRRTGAEIPFHGSADLPGEFAMEILETG